MAPVLPSEDAVLTAREKTLGTDVTSKFFPPPKHSNQSDSSYKEQTKLMEQFRLLIDQYLSASTKHRNFVIVGGPGVGKTTVAMICTLSCLSIGMNGITTSIVSDCSKELEGSIFIS
jgi:DNA replication protein DnaC